MIAAPLCWEGPSRHAWTHPANLTAGVTARTAATCGDTSAYGSRNLLSAYRGMFNLVARRTESLTPNGEHIWVCPVVARLFAEERTAGRGHRRLAHAHAWLQRSARRWNYVHMPSDDDQRASVADGCAALTVRPKLARSEHPVTRACVPCAELQVASAFRTSLALP